MFGLGLPEVAVILVIVLLMFGPKKLPELAKSLGKGINEFKRATREFKSEIDSHESAPKQPHQIENQAHVTPSHEEKKSEKV